MTIINGTPSQGLTDTALLTSKDEIKDLFSIEGVENHTEDLDNADRVLDRIVNQASERVLLYLRSQFDAEDLAANVWVREQATYIAAHLLSIRLGNPSLYGALVDQALNDLALVRDGNLSLDVASNARALVQTPRLDNRSFHPGRVDKKNSTTVKPGQRGMNDYYGNLYRE